jgi:hypothetical protein
MDFFKAWELIQLRVPVCVNELRRDEVLLLKKLGYEKWKQIKDAGRRWIAEIVFSSIKRVLGEDLFSKKFSPQKVKAGLKIMLYNKFISL